MRCPICSQWNRASLPRCVRCGAELKTEGPVTPSWRSQLRDDKVAKEYVRVDEDGDISVSPDDREVLAAEMAELKARKDAGQQLKDRLRAEAEARTAAPTLHVHMPEEPRKEEPLFGLTEEGVTRTEEQQAEAAPESPAPEGQTPFRRSRNPRGTRVVLSSTQWEDSRAYDPLVDAMQQNNVFQQPPNLKELGPLPSRRISQRKLIRLITLALVIGVMGLAGYFAYTVYDAQRDAEAAKNRALVTASIVDDQAAHTILIPGEDGQQIFISNEEIRASYTVVGGFATIEIPDYTWYENIPDITEETMSVTLVPYIKTASKQKPMDPITYEISIPLSPIKLVTPDALRTEVTTAMYSMLFNVRPGSKVTINGVDVSDTINERGELTYNATVQPIGDNVYNVAVRSPYCRDNSMAVTLYREVQEIPLDLSATTYTSTNDPVILINCNTIPGADIDILSPHSDLKITELDTTGEFSFNAVFDHIGYNTISITASYPGKKTSQVDYTIYYVPNPDIYTRAAWPLNAQAEYAELLSNIEFRAARTQVYLGVGKIAYFVSEDKPQLAVMYCSDDGQSRPVLLENQTKTTWKVGEYYNIYCDAFSTYNGMPWLIARYTY